MNTNLKISLRSIERNKVHSFICITGLGIGLGSILLLSMLYIHNKSFDKFIPDYKNVYRVLLGNSAQTAYPLAEALNAENPAISGFFRYFQKKDVEIKDTQNQIIQDADLGFADPGLFSVWGVKMISGSAAKNRTEIAISKTIEQKYFNGESALGKQMNIRVNEDFLSLTVCGIYNDFPSNSTLSPKFVAYIDLCSEALGFSQKMFGAYNLDLEEFKNWNKTNFYTYVQLVPSAKPDDVASFMQKYAALADNENLKEKAYSLQPAANIYLATNVDGSFFSRLGNAKDLRYYLAIASLILLIAIINYVFLNKAKIESRLKEIGSQKALGAPKRALRGQIILESNLVAFLSLIPATAVIFYGIPFINNTLNQTLGLHVLSYWETWGSLLGIVLLTGTLSGIFIAYGVVKVPSILLLKGKKTTVPKREAWNNAILSVHFTIFIILVSGVITLNKQIKFALTDFIGIDPENVMVYELNSDNLSKQFGAIKNEVDKLPGVVASAGSSFVPPFNDFMPLKLQDPEENKVGFDGLIMGQGMIELLSIKVIDGESFGEYQEGTPEIIYNESAAKKYNLKAGELFCGLKIRAIVKDFNAHSMRDLIKPMAIIQQHPEKMRMLVVKTNGANNGPLFKSIHQILTTIAPDKVVEGYMLSDQINQFYSSEKSQAKLVNAFALLAIFLSVIGLLGMTYNAMLQRTKEIGIRKVNGAKISEVLIMLNKDFVKWVAIAFLIATPIAYYAMDIWLQNFAYKTELNWWIFALAGILALGIALLTVSWQSWGAATKNPVEALRSE